MHFLTTSCTCIVANTVCTTILHTLSLVGTSVQVTVDFLVLVGHLPKSDANILYRIEEQSDCGAAFLSKLLHEVYKLIGDP